MTTKKPFDLTTFIRPNILSLLPYRCARDDYSEGILLDANENAIGHPLSSNGTDSCVAFSPTELEALHLNRYPDPSFAKIKEKLANLRGFSTGHSGVFLGVGSDEVIDIVFRVSCVPGKDSITICPPTYGMYPVCATINDVTVNKVPLDVGGGRFLPDMDALFEHLSTASPPPKLLCLCSPGNPTGTLIPLEDIRRLCDYPKWKGMVVVDEAYIDFADPEGRGVGSAITLLNEGYENLIVTQTFSKGFGLAGIRLGMSFSSPAFAQILFNAKAPYSISSLTADVALKALQPPSVAVYRQNVQTLVENRTWLIRALESMGPATGVGPILGANHANFIVVRILLRGSKTEPDNARAASVYKTLAEEMGLVVRFRGNELGCQGCVRITVGTRKECEAVIERLAKALEQH